MGKSIGRVKKRRPGYGSLLVAGALGAAAAAAGAAVWLNRSTILTAALAAYEGENWRSARGAAIIPPFANIASVDARRMPFEAIAAAIAASPGEPLLLRGAAAAWPGARDWWADRAAFLERYANVSVGVGVGFRISHKPNRDGLFYSWSGPGAGTARPESPDARALRSRFEAAAARGDVPALEIGDLVGRVRDGSLPYDAYAFTPVDETRLARDVPEVEALWRRLADTSALGDAAGEAEREGGPLVAGALLGLGGAGSGIMFHAHHFALNALFAGHKRWFIYPSNKITDAFIGEQFEAAKRAHGGAFPFDSTGSWVDHIYPLPSFQRKWQRVGFECVQGPGDLLYIPRGLSHGTLNLDETLALSVQGSRFLQRTDPRAKGALA